MNITFRCIGLEFEADAFYIPAQDDTWEEPGWGEEVEINSLTYKGQDASVLLASDLREDIEAAVIMACVRAIKAANDGRLEQAAISLKEDREYA